MRHGKETIPKIYNEQSWHSKIPFCKQTSWHVPIMPALWKDEAEPNLENETQSQNKK